MAKTIRIKIKQTVETDADTSGLKDLGNELVSLRKQLNEATDPKEIERLDKAFNETKKRLKEINLAAKATNIKKPFEETEKAVKPLTVQMRKLEEEMQLLAFAGKANTEEFRTLQEQALSMQSAIDEVDKSFQGVSEQKDATKFFKSFGSELGGIGESLLSLDFDGAANQANNLAQNAGKISFKKAAKSVGNLGKTFLNLGKVLLTNPIFLIATVITAIVVGIVALLDKLGILEKIFEVVGDSISFVIDKLKEFLDWLGLTDFAGEEAAQNTIDRNNKLIESEQKKSEAVTATFDFEIAKRQALGEETEEIERQKLQALVESGERQIKLNNEIALSVAKLNGKDSEEYKAAIAAVEESKKTFLAAQRELELFEIKADKDSEKREEEKVKRAREFAKKRLQAERLVEDLKLQLIKDDTERELEANRIKYERLIEDTKTNEDLLQSEKAKLIDLYEQQQTEQETKILKDRENQKKAIVKEQQELLNDARLNGIEDGIERERQIARDAEEQAFQDKIEDLKERGVLTNEIEAELLIQKNEALDKIDEEANLKRRDILNRDAAARLELELLRIKDEGILKLEAQKALLEEQMRQELLNEDLTENEKLLIRQRYADQIKALEDEDLQRTKDIEAQKRDATISSAEQGLQAVGSLSELATQIQLSNAEKGSKREEQIQRQNFERNKKIQIGLATIQGVQGVINALTATSVIPEPFASIQRAANAVAIGAATTANIAKIKNTQFQGGGSSAPSTGGAGGGRQAGGGQTQEPSVNFFGGANDFNEQTQRGEAEAAEQSRNQPLEISVVEIDKVKGRVDNIVTGSEL